MKTIFFSGPDRLQQVVKIKLLFFILALRWSWKNKVLFNLPLEWSGKNKFLFSFPKNCSENIVFYLLFLTWSILLLKLVSKMLSMAAKLRKMSENPEKSYFNDTSRDFCRMLRNDRLEEAVLSYNTEQTGPLRNGNIVKCGFQQCPYFTIVRETAPCI